MEYIGKKMDACPTGITSEGFKFGFCHQSGLYLYATDMSIQESRQYFKNTIVQSDSSTEPVAITDSDSIFVGLSGYTTHHVINDSNSGFNVGYYFGNNFDTTLRKLSLKKTNKKYLMSIPSGEYKYILQYAL